MTNSPTDFYHQKTNDELRFFIENPAHYQPDIVAEARRELRRRGVVWAVPMPVSEPGPVAPAPARPLVSGPLLLALAAVLVLSMGGFYYLKQKNAPKATAQAAPARKKAPPQLIDVPTAAIPNYNVASFVEQQQQKVPAAERATAQADGAAQRQYRELAKRFWTAECQTEYLLNQAQTGKAGPLFAQQTLLARATWSEWNKAVVYRYKFGPVMQRHLALMSDVASSQQHLLEMYPGLLPNREFASDKEAVSRAADVEYWLHDLRPVSPVTGLAYKAPTLTIRM